MRVPFPSLNHLHKAPTPTIFILGSRVSTNKFLRDLNIQFITKREGGREREEGRKEMYVLVWI
jgi:hypothetical protein